MEINRLHILTDEQLVKMAQEGSDTAEEILIEKYKGLVKNKANTILFSRFNREAPRFICLWTIQNVRNE